MTVSAQRETPPGRGRRWGPRVRLLPDHGTLLVSADLHGSLADFRRLVEVFHAARADDPDTHWALLGDCVHGPSPSAASYRPALYGYVDQSPELVEELSALAAAHPGRIHYLLGNHDHGHVGGCHTAKFHDDEVLALERRLTVAALRRMCAFFEGALLAIVAPCGLLLTHGAPDDSLQDFVDLDRIGWRPADNDSYRAEVLEAWLWHYGQPKATAARLLHTASLGSGLDLRVNVHGHDRDEAGWFVEQGNQACPVIFGAPRANKRYLRVDLGARYGDAAALRLEHEVLPLYPSDEAAERAGTRDLARDKD